MGTRESASPILASGFVLVRDGTAGLEYLSLVSRKHTELGLPKGHAEPGESELETALRETEEETGIRDPEVVGDFRRVIQYTVTRRGKTDPKQVIYLLARLRGGDVRLSEEHSGFAWLGLKPLLHALPFDDLKEVVHDAALFLKDPALFELEPATERDADQHMRSLPEASDVLMAHVRGGARLARQFAVALDEAGVEIHVEAAAVGALLHDVGRALGEHADHQRAGLRHLRGRGLAAYGFACISHFTKGATNAALRAAGVDDALLADFRALIDGSTLTWEERCVALADACMKGAEAVRPAERFEDLRRRYHEAVALVDLQEGRTEIIRREIEDVIGRDPLAVAGM